MSTKRKHSDDNNNNNNNNNDNNNNNKRVYNIDQSVLKKYNIVKANAEQAVDIVQTAIEYLSEAKQNNIGLSSLQSIANTLRHIILFQLPVILTNDEQSKETKLSALMYSYQNIQTALDWIANILQADNGMVINPNHYLI